MGAVETGGEESKKEEVKEEVKQQADGEEKEEDEVCFPQQSTPPAFCTPLSLQLILSCSQPFSVA
jgi:hypothetical protein